MRGRLDVSSFAGRSASVTARGLSVALAVAVLVVASGGGRGAVARAEGVAPTVSVAATSASALSVEDAVARALRSNPRLGAARDRLRAGGELSTSFARRSLPVIHVTDELQVYDSPFVINFPGASGDGFRARDRTTNTFVASLNQPLLGLARLDRERRSADEGDAAAAIDVAAQEADLRQAVESAFLQYFEAVAIESIATTSASELAAEAIVARARLASGVITQADVLRIEVAGANARQQALQARSQGGTVRARLFALMGVDATDEAERDVKLVEPRALLVAAEAPAAPLPALLVSARRNRVEVAGRLHLARAAELQASARLMALLPDINLEAAFLRVDGQIFTPKNSAFVGLKADWAIWEWGASEHQRRAAQAQATAAARDVEATARQIESDVASNAAAGEAARGAVAAATEAIASAEEAFRVTEAGVKAGTATTTDLLESQAALTQARLNATRARYELALAYVGLRRASGL